ncbi:MAG: helicase [Chromatiaceae bacterium]|nr:MAG: helicase [Chromatiaceae bacterium]
MQTPNPHLQLAQYLIRGTDLSVFLTGKAGTGKTTFLHALKADLPKRTIITAPTGVAAINAGGVTLHSFFQLPFGPWVPGAEAARRAAERRLPRQKREIIQGLDLLVIDEISMVRCDLLDAVDCVLRRERRCDQPFGGVQLLMIGDLHQLAPVVPAPDWAILKDWYESAYFFSSRTLQATEMVSIALEQIYRQTDADFIELLNRVRDNRLDAAALARLNSRYRPDFRPGEADGYITLTTHNRGADRINERHLGALGTKAYRFAAQIQGDYPAHGYPTAENLTLKQGTQVMFVRNDTTSAKRWFNGKIGTVAHLGRERIAVRCPGDATAIEVEPVTWENIQYRLDPETKALTQEVIGTFTQYPLRLAWAITIHKSQGLTFERAIVDAGAAFSPGQVYVALSRCKTFEGLVLGAPIPRRAVMTDPVVAGYVAEATRHPPTPDQIERASRAYQQRLLLECWDFNALGAHLQRLLGLLRNNRRVLDANGADVIDALEHQTNEAVVAVAARFRQQLRSLFREDLTPEADERVQERVRKASAYFSARLQQGLCPWLATFSFGTGNQALRKTLQQAVDELRKALLVKTAAVESCQEGFTTATHLGALARARIDAESGGQPSTRQAPGRPPDPAGAPGLPAALRRWRDQRAADELRAGVTRHRILTRAVLRQIAATLPQDPQALAAIKGIGKHSVERYGDEILSIVFNWCRRQSMEAAAIPRPGPRHQTESGAPDGDTRAISYRLYQEGLGIAQIAERRALKPTSIEGHLAHYIRAGTLAVTAFIDEEKVARIAAVLAQTGPDAFGLAKQALGNDCSYGEIKMVQAHLARVR